MKVGREAEGRFKGIMTLFIDASEVMDCIKIEETVKQYNIGHIYISDRENTLDYSTVHALFADDMVTLDVTEVRDEELYDNITIILTLPHSYWDSIKNMRSTDQIKFHSHNRDVKCVTMQSFVTTDPSEFLGDIEI